MALLNEGTNGICDATHWHFWLVVRKAGRNQSWGHADMTSANMLIFDLFLSRSRTDISRFVPFVGFLGTRHPSPSVDVMYAYPLWLPPPSGLPSSPNSPSVRS